MTSRRTPHVGLFLIIFLSLLIFSCHKAAAPPPPPPPPPSSPPPPPPAPAITLRADPSTIDRGQSTTLTWEARNAGTVRIEPGIGTVAASGNRQVNPTSSVTYTATATGPGGTATDTARITVNTPAPPAERPPEPRRTTPDVTVEELFRQNVQEIYFDYDKADVRPDQVSKLQSSAAWLKDHSNVKFTIEGHCDERGSQEYNLGLGDRRANAVKEFLASQGVQGSRMNAISYGEERPQCREQTEDCYQKNRRAAFTLTP